MIMPQSNVLEERASKIALSRVGSRNVMAPKGSLTYQNIESLKTMFQECLNSNRSEVILDCGAISFIDSETLELILGMHEDLKKQGGSLKLINVAGICQDILMATRLINVFHVYKDIHNVLRNRI
jgi:anti-anti-sigma factor